MTNISRFAAVIVGPGALLCLALVGYTTIDAYLIGNCDPKFGCAGALKLPPLLPALRCSVHRLATC